MQAEGIEELKCGCYATDPSIIGAQFEKALVPLKNINYSIEIVNSLVSITLTQKYYNPIDKFLSVYYSLPINPDSSIYKFEVEFANTKIEGIVKEKEQAKKEFEKAKSQGKQAVIGTIDSQSKDILNFDIGNIPPQSEFIIIISMLQQMKISQNTFYKLHIPSTISPRYMNKVNGESKLAEHQIKKGKSSGKVDFTWAFKIDIQTTRKVVFFNSPTHSLTLLNQNKKGTETLLVMEKSEIPNKDFTFLFTTQDFHLPGYVLGNTDISSTVMLSFIPKFCELNVNDAYNAQIKNKSHETDISSAKGDYVFLLDRSGSMGGSRIQKAKQALILFLKSLPQDSYFNIISFGSSSEKMFKNSQIYTTKQVQQVVKKIQLMTADLGGTEIYDPLSQLLNQKVKEGYPRHVFLLTDGGVSNTQGVIQMVRKNTKFNRIHTIGVGYGASLDLINGCAEAGKGKSVLIADEENPSDKIIELLQATLTPLISKANLKYENKNQIQSIVPNPNQIPYILKDQVVNFYITFKGPITQKQTFQFSYQDSITKFPYKSILEVNPSSTLNQPFVDKMAHFKVIRSLENSAKDGVNIQDQMYYVKVKDFKKEAIDYSVKHQVLSQYTAFICLGKHLIDGQLQQFETKGIFQIHVEQPQPQPYVFKGKSGKVKCASNGAISYSKRGGCGVGKGGKGVGGMGKVGTKRITQKRCNKSTLDSINKPSIKRLARRGGVKRISSFVYDDSKQILKGFLEGIVRDTVIYTEHAKRKTITSFDAINALKGQERTIYGYGDGAYPSQRTRSQQKQKYMKMKDKKLIQEQFFEQKQKGGRIDVSKIIKLQLVNGSWEELSLIDKLAKYSQQVKAIANELGKDFVVTKLVVAWLQKHHPEKQYALIIKKALSWIKKNISQKSIHQQKLKAIESI